MGISTTSPPDYPRQKRLQQPPAARITSTPGLHTTAGNALQRPCTTHSFLSVVSQYIPFVELGPHLVEPSPLCRRKTWGSNTSCSPGTETRSPAPYLNTPVSAVSTSPPHSTHPTTRHTDLPPDATQRKPRQAASLIGKPPTHTRCSILRPLVILTRSRFAT